VTDLAVPYLAYAEANWGRWIAPCPAPYCHNAMQIDQNQQIFRCLGPDSCGLETQIQWPPDPDGIELLLGVRPDFITRNWKPGETLEDLLRENTEHDLLPAEWLALAEAHPDGRLELLGTTGGVITSGVLLEVLPAGRPRPAIGA
jgi:hypothetical protein